MNYMNKDTLKKYKIEAEKIKSEIKELNVKTQKAIADIQSSESLNANQVTSLIQSSFNYLMQEMNYLNSRMDNLSSALWNHTDPSTHLPPCPGAGGMTSAIKGLGWDKDYQVAKRTVYASKDYIVDEE